MDVAGGCGSSLVRALRLRKTIPVARVAVNVCGAIRNCTNSSSFADGAVALLAWAFFSAAASGVSILHVRVMLARWASVVALAPWPCEP